jgi:sugar phosphate isomerase/epimerase
MWSGARGDWGSLAALAVETSSFAVELAALDEAELDGLAGWLRSGGRELPHRYVSVHGPAKNRVRPERELVAALRALPAWVDAIVLHPDTFEAPRRYRSLGHRLVLENMDARKPTGRTAEELEPYFTALPEAGFCLDVAHVASVDPTMAAGEELLDAFGARLRHVHVSSLDAEGAHVALRDADEERFCPLLSRCIDVPWILEAPLPGPAR